MLSHTHANYKTSKLEVSFCGNKALNLTISSNSCARTSLHESSRMSAFFRVLQQYKEFWECAVAVFACKLREYASTKAIPAMLRQIIVSYVSRMFPERNGLDMLNLRERKRRIIRTSMRHVACGMIKKLHKIRITRRKSRNMAFLNVLSIISEVFGS